MDLVTVVKETEGDTSYYTIFDYKNSFRCRFKETDSTKFMLDLQEMMSNTKYNRHNEHRIDCVGNCIYLQSNWIRIKRIPIIIDKFLSVSGVRIDGTLKDEKDLRTFLGLKSKCKKYIYNRLSKKSLNELSAIESMIAK